MLDHPDYEFDNGIVSHEYLMVEYLLNDTLMEESVRLKLNDAGAKISKLKAGIRFSTSDVDCLRCMLLFFMMLTASEQH